MGPAMMRRAIRFLRNVVTGSPDEEEEPSPALVLLLESPLELTREAALELAAQAWGEADRPPSADRHKGGWLLRVSEISFTLRSARVRYRRRGHETSQVRQRVWDRHRAWVAVEYPDGPKIPEWQWPSCYKLLLLMAHELWDENCLGVYLPAQGITIPNMGDLIGSIRWAGNNGTPLPFLHETAEQQA